MIFFILYLIIAIIIAGIIHYQTNQWKDTELEYPIEKFYNCLSDFAIGLVWPLWLVAIIVDLISKFCKFVTKK